MTTIEKNKLIIIITLQIIISIIITDIKIIIKTYKEINKDKITIKDRGARSRKIKEKIKIYKERII